MGGYLIPTLWGWKSLDYILGLLWTRRNAGGEFSLIESFQIISKIFLVEWHTIVRGQLTNECPQHPSTS